MKYEFLSSAYYKDITLEHYNELYRSRFESEAAYKIPKLDVHGNPAFFMMLPQFSLMIENIFANAVKIIDILDRIPTPAAVKFSNESLIDEIIITNNIEGIYSTRKEINALSLTAQQIQKYSNFQTGHGIRKAGTLTGLYSTKPTK